MGVRFLKTLGLTAAVVGTGLAVHAADYTWLGNTGNWLDALNWSTGGATSNWVDGHNAIFQAGGPNLNIAIGSAVAPGQMTIRDNYVFSGDGPVTLNGYCYVAENKTATYEVPLKSTSQFKTGEVGTTLIKGGAEFAKLLVETGTLRLAEDTTVKVTDESTGANGTGGSSLALTGGNLVLEKGSKLELAATSKFVPNSGTGVTISGGTLDVSKVNEFLIGFNDINMNNGTMKSKRSFVTVENGGKLMAKTIRLSKAKKAEMTSNPEYARLNINPGGFVGFNNIYIESDAFYGEINFDGGVLEHTPTQSQTEKNYSMISHANMSLKVKEGGAHIKLVNNKPNRYFSKAFESAAEKDGGFTIEGESGVVAYMNVTNTFNGPTTLAGGGFIYVPKYDRALGLEPAEPTDNIIVASSSPTLHADTSFDLHKNRDVLIKANTNFRVGNTGDLRLLGQIKSDPAAPDTTSLQVLGNWAGAFTLATTDGRENKIGRVRSDGHLVIADGTTTITKPSTDVHGSAAIYATRTSTAEAFSKNYGVIEVTGGTLKAVPGARYTETQNYGQIKVSGGKLDVSSSIKVNNQTQGQEILNGLDSPGRVEVSGTGEIAAYIVRATQVLESSKKAYGDDGLPAAQIHVATGGVLRLHHFSIDYSKSGLVGRIDLDGGTIVCRSSQNKLIGSPTSPGNWEKIPVRVCAGGAIVDTAGFTCEIPLPLVSACENDGGFRKRGSGKLTLRGDNTYNGPTRTDMGQLVFGGADVATSFAVPGDIEVSVSELSKLSDTQRLGTYIEAKSIRADAKLRVTDIPVLADGKDPRTTFGTKIAILKTKEPMTKAPEVVLVDKDGNEKPGNGHWAATLSADGKTLTFGPSWITMIILR